MPGYPVKFEFVACFVVLRDESGYSLLMLRRASTDDHAAGISQIVYGHIEDGETPEGTVLREVTEETGLIVGRLYSLNETFAFYDKVSGCMQLTPVFVAFVDRSNEATIDEREHVSYDWVPFSSAAKHLPWQAQRRAFAVLSELLTEGDLPEIMRINFVK